MTPNSGDGPNKKVHFGVEQHAALKAAGCTKIFEDKITGTARKRTGLARALKICAAGDVLIVWRRDRLGRSLGHLIELLSGLAARGVQFRSLTKSIDTTTPTASAPGWPAR